MALTPFASVAVTFAVKDPDVAYVWVVGLALDVPPSPKNQIIVNGPTPPVVVEVKVAGEPASGVVGL